jgi:NAD(P)-dependent dehydrogenase (short-subunit alcohol dehydrogenase family)
MMLTGRRILVTGFTGRLGAAFAEFLAADNEVTGVPLAASDERSSAAARSRWLSRSHGPSSNAREPVRLHACTSCIGDRTSVLEMMQMY